MLRRHATKRNNIGVSAHTLGVKTRRQPGAAFDVGSQFATLAQQKNNIGSTFLVRSLGRVQYCFIKACHRLSIATMHIVLFIDGITYEIKPE